MTTKSAGLIDLRSDTVTQPPDEMRKAMAAAVVGDDVYREDPTINDLEILAANIMGKESAVFVPSGSMGNLVSGLSWCPRGSEAIVGDNSHILLNEVGALAAFGAVQMRPIPTNYKGMLNPDQVRKTIRPKVGFFPTTGMVEIENTHNRAGGTAISRSEIEEVLEIAHQSDIPVHLDGARIFNAAIAQSMPVDELVANIDSLTFCLSKGLSCPVGSLVCGSEEFINRARKFRKMLGGGMRQAGILAAAGIWALNNMVSRLIEDHDNAQKMFSLLQNISEVEVLNKSVDTNMVYLRPRNIETGLFVSRLKEKGVLVGSMYGSVRMVTHYGINSEDIDATVEAIEHTLK
mgnify:FL=1